MTVNVQNHLNISFFHYFFNLILYIANFRNTFALVQMPISIQIISRHIASIIAENNSIYIYHRKYVEIEFG